VRGSVHDKDQFAHPYFKLWKVSSFSY
jgi:hypothetical protein